MNNGVRPRFRRRLLVASLTSLLALPLFFVPIPLFLVAAPWLLEIGEPFASVAMYGSCIGLSGAVSFAINRYWLRGTWLATATTMIGPYFIVGALWLALGLVHLGLARNPDHFIIRLHLLPLFGLIG